MITQDLQQKKWYIIDSESNGDYSQNDEIFNQINRIKSL